MIDLQQLKDFERNLQDSPMYILSLSSKELFHSNFLAWLTDTYKAEMTNVWSRYLSQENRSWGRIVDVDREKKHRDLTFEFEHGQRLVVEVKVKSVPEFAQLEKYMATLLKEKTKRGSSRSGSSEAESQDFQLALLSFFDLQGRAANEERGFKVDGKRCSWILWAELAQSIQAEFKTLKDGYHKALITDYCEFIAEFGRIAPGIEIDWARDRNFFLDDDRKDEKVKKQLQELRLHDLVFKARYLSLAQKLVEKVGKTARRAPWLEGNTGEVLTSSAMTNATGVASIGYVLSGRDKNPNKVVVAGIQLQHRSYRFFFMGLGCDKDAILACAQELNDETGRNKKLWFHTGELDDIAAPESMRGEFCQYDQVFYYRYRNIDQAVSPDDLADMMVQHIADLKNNRHEIEPIIKRLV